MFPHLKEGLIAAVKKKGARMPDLLFLTSLFLDIIHRLVISIFL